MKALIVDDEIGNRLLLASMLKKHCPTIGDTFLAESVDKAHETIRDKKPDIVFLDIKMPGKNGFDLLRMYETLPFSVIFVTGFDEYAIKAFEFNAVDYLLKPIDHHKLIKAVNKVQEKQFEEMQNNVIHFVHSLEEETNLVKRLTIHGNDKVKVIDVKDILYIEANKGYSEIMCLKNEKHISTKSLTDYEELLAPIINFIRVNKSFIININFIDSYTKGNECNIRIKNSPVEIEVSRRKKSEVLLRLKSH